PALRVERQRGVAFVAGREVTAEVFDPLVADGVGWISQTPFGWQRRFDDPTFEMVTAGRVFWGETDRGLAETARMAHARGIRTLLKPQLWLADRSNGRWTGSIAMRSEADWRRWF